MPVGIVTAYDLTVGVKVNMDEAIYVLSPLDTPMLNGMDADGLSVIGSGPLDEIEFSWMDEQLLVPRAALAAEIVTTAATDFVLTATEKLKFSTGDFIKVVKAGGNEIVRVTGYSLTTATNILVTRGFDGTTPTALATGTLLIGLGTGLAEGSDPENARSRDRDTDSNYSQIFGPTSVKMSETELVVAKYGVSNEFARQLYNRTKENAISREQAFLYGRKYNSTTTEIRSTGGLDYFITTNVDSTSTQLTVASVQGMGQDSFNQGGVWDRLMASPHSFGDLNDVSNTSQVRTTMEVGRRGRQPVTEIVTEFGVFLAVRNRWLAPFHAFGFSRENVRRRIMRPLQFEALAKTGDSRHGMIVCEEGLEVNGQEHMAKWTALGYTE